MIIIRKLMTALDIPMWRADLVSGSTPSTAAHQRHGSCRVTNKLHPHFGTVYPWTSSTCEEVDEEQGIVDREFRDRLTIDKKYALLC